MVFKHQIIVAVIVFFFMKYSLAGIRCFTCVNAPSNEACNENGKIEVCAPNEQSCQNEVRINTPNGFGYLITKRCKQPLACKNNQDQNDKPAWDPTQCNLLFEKNSVCRCCCRDDLCNKKELPCNDIERCASRGDLEGGNVECTNNNFLGTSCRYSCDQGFELEGQEIIECVDTGDAIMWTGAQPVCKPGSCRGFMQAPVNGRMSCTNGARVGSSCSFECSLGYNLIGSDDVLCQLNGNWENQPPRCERIRCQSQQDAPTNGAVVCSSQNLYDSICQFTCNTGYFMTGFGTTACQLDGTWTTEAPTCSRVFCEERPNAIQDGKISCSDENFYESTCSYSCNQGFFMRGAATISCLSDFTWSAAEPTCEPITCNPRPRSPNRGNVVCSDDNLYASVCAFDCDEGYYMDGPETTTCQEDFSWTDKTPECKRIICPVSHDSVVNGKVKCTEGNEYGSICKFTCDDGFFIIGPEFLTCQENFEWSDSAPICKAYTCGPELSPPSLGRVDCTNGNKSFSECKYSCGDGSDYWETKGETVTTCTIDPFTNKYAWNNIEPPCCAKRCPPFAQIDLFIVLDSSSSVGRDNWNKTLNFAAGILKDFAISPEDLLVGAIRYNAVVDVKSEIKVGQYTTKQSTVDAILSLPYDGQGTNTGNALQYVVDRMLTHPGNRPTVQDMVLLVTDGISRDDVKLPAQKLRATGTNVVALGISNKAGGLKEEDILDITNDPEKTVLLTTGFDGLTPDLVKVFIRQICTNPCDRANQYGNFALNFLQ
ncbi:P-selectin-like [Styela clava]